MATTKVTGNLINDLPSDVVATADLADLAVTTAKIEDLNVTTAKIANSAVDYTKVAAGAVVQVVNVQNVAMSTGSTTIPADDTIPQSGEGFEVMTLAITPKSATNKLLIEVVVVASHASDQASVVAALFQDLGASAIACVSFTQSAAGGFSNQRLVHYMTSGGTSATTFKVRVGSATAGTITINGVGGARYYGGVLCCSITITEIKA